MRYYETTNARCFKSLHVFLLLNFSPFYQLSNKQKMILPSLSTITYRQFAGVFQFVRIFPSKFTDLTSTQYVCVRYLPFIILYLRNRNLIMLKLIAIIPTLIVKFPHAIKSRRLRIKVK